MMYDYLDDKRFPEKDNCDVFVETIPDSIVFQSTTGGSAAVIMGISKWVMGMCAIVGFVVLGWP